ncbi:MAG TPA: class I SAM-dependent methyltransferase [Dermatophilaceae bacterium]|nr:class I SAM-dependent methyltransferase [Dermatophilaceae bacterium]
MLLLRPRPKLPYTPEKEAEWDLLWISYFKREAIQHLSLQKNTNVPLPADRDAMIDDARFFLGCAPSAIIGKTVLEVGCGAGYLPKLVARHTRRFVGIDWSGLALLVATRTCPERTVFLHPRERRVIRRWAGKVDSVVCRHFVIHQNMERMRGLLAFEAQMLTAGGRVYADFWHDNLAIHDGRGVFDALEDPAVPNAVFRFTDDQVSELAAESGLRIVEDYRRADKLRRFVTFERPE